MTRFNPIVGHFLGLSLLLCGCHDSGVHGPDPTALVDQSAVQTGAYLDSASRSLEGLKARVTKELQAWVTSIQELLKQGQLQVDATLKANEAERADKAKVVKRAESAEKERDDLKHSWGHRLQVWITAGFWTIVALTGFHYLGMAIALLMPTVGIWGVVGRFLAIASRAVNPAAWASSLADNIWFRRVAPTAPAPMATPAPPSAGVKASV